MCETYTKLATKKGVAMTQEEKLARMVAEYSQPRHIRAKNSSAYIPVPRDAPITNVRDKFTVAVALDATGIFSRVTIG